MKHLFWAILLTIFSSTAASAQVFPPDLLCLSGDTIVWNTPVNTCGPFNSYQIYFSTNFEGPYSLLTSVTDPTQTTFVHPNPGNLLYYYYMTSDFDCPGEPGAIEITWVRWSWKLWARCNSRSATPRIVGCWISAWLDGERAISAPVRRVLRPEKSSLPGGVASTWGAISALIASIRSTLARSSMISAASRSSTSWISSTLAVAGRWTTLMARP